MLIQSPEKKYEVMKYCFADSRMERYICRENGTGVQYTIVRIKDKAVIRNVMGFFMQQLGNSHFTDFSACFMAEESLHIVMKYVDGMPLSDKLRNEICPLEERLEIGRKILEQIMLQNMPGYFLQDCLKLPQILITAGLDIHFDYGLSRCADYDKSSFVQIQGRLYKVWSALFEEELRKKLYEPLETFCMSLKKGKFQDILEIYTAYDHLCKAMLGLSPEELSTPKTWPFRLWEKIRRFIPMFKRLIALALFTAAVLFLVYSVKNAMSDGAVKQTFESIGTLQIKGE